jgi:hypothetical protein
VHNAESGSMSQHILGQTGEMASKASKKVAGERRCRRNTAELANELPRQGSLQERMWNSMYFGADSVRFPLTSGLTTIASLSTRSFDANSMITRSS